MRTLALLFPLFLVAPGLAQGSTPGFSLAPKASFMIINSVTSVPGQDIRSVHHVQLPGDVPGTWTTALSVGSLENWFGGDGKSSGLVLGLFDPGKGTFVVNQEAKALNSSADESNFYLDAKGLWAIFRSGNSIMLASRAKVGTAFGKPVAVTGFGALQDPSPSLARVGGQDVCFYSDGTSILSAPIDLKNAKVDLTKATLVSHVVQKGARPFAPTPLIGADGDCEGVLFSEEVSITDSDLVWAGDLDPTTPALLFMQRPDYTNNASPAGGYISWAHRDLPKLPWHLMHSEAAWLLGDIEAPGGLMDITLAAVTPAPSQVASFVFGSTNLWQAVPVSGFGGTLGINPLTMVLLGFALHTDQGGLTQLSITVPNQPALKGVVVQIQAVAVNSTNKSFTLGSTSHLQIK